MRKLILLLLILTPIAVFSDTDVAEPDTHYLSPEEVKLDKVITDLGIIQDQLKVLNTKVNYNLISGEITATRKEQKKENKNVKIASVYFSGLMGLWGLSTGGVYSTITGLMFITISYITATDVSGE